MIPARFAAPRYREVRTLEGPDRAKAVAWVAASLAADRRRMAPPLAVVHPLRLICGCPSCPPVGPSCVDGDGVCRVCSP